MSLFPERNPRLVYSAETLVNVAHAKNLLEHAGIACRIRNEYGGSVIGEVPIFAVWPELWVDDERDVDAARRIIDDLLDNGRPVQGADWPCPQCGSDNGPAFAVCWNCQTPAPD